MGLDHVVHDEAVDVLGALVQQVVGDALEDLEALRGQGALRIGGLRHGGGGLFSDPAGVCAAGHDGDLALEAVQVLHAELLAQHSAAELAVVGQLGLLDECVSVAVLGGGVVVVAAEEGREEHGAGAGVDAGALELGLAFLRHLGLEAGQAVVLRLAQELGDGEAADVILLLGGEDALVCEGLAGGLFDLGVAELAGELLDVPGQGLALRFFLAGFELSQSGVELGGNLVGVSHFVS